MSLSPFQERIFPTLSEIERKAEKSRKLYKKRIKKHEGRRSKKERFILYAACELFKEKNPGIKTGFSKLVRWLDEEYHIKYVQKINYKEYDFDLKKLYKWKASNPFKEMQWETAWNDLKVSCDISLHSEKKEMSHREIMIKHSLSKQELKDLTPHILTQNVRNQKTSNKFIFNRPDK